MKKQNNLKESSMTQLPGQPEQPVRQQERQKQESAPPDEHRVFQRMKQINFGLITLGYYIYRAHHPQGGISLFEPPNPHNNCSKREMDSLLSEWRRRLHYWDGIKLPLDYEKDPDWINKALPTIQNAENEVSKFTVLHKQEISAPEPMTENIPELSSEFFFDPTKLLISPVKPYASALDHTFFSAASPITSRANSDRFTETPGFVS